MPDTTQADAREPTWSHEPWPVVLALLFCLPLGVALLWFSRRIRTLYKALVSLVVIALAGGATLFELHTGYVTESLDADIAGYRARGMTYLTPEPVVNPIGQRLIYFAPEASMGARMHITALPA